MFVRFFFFHDPTTTEIYTLSLHDALPICDIAAGRLVYRWGGHAGHWGHWIVAQLAERFGELRSEEHTSELQSRENLVCRLLLEKKKVNRQHDLSVIRMTIDVHRKAVSLAA